MIGQKTRPKGRVLLKIGEPEKGHLKPTRIPIPFAGNTEFN